MAETIDTILERMLLQIPSRYDTSSGTYTYDIERGKLCNRLCDCKR